MANSVITKEFSSSSQKMADKLDALINRTRPNREPRKVQEEIIESPDFTPDTTPIRPKGLN